MKTSDKIIDSLKQLMEAFAELRESLEDKFGSSGIGEDDSDEDLEAANEELFAAVTSEMRSALESVMENEDVEPTDIAAVLSSLSDALEEIDPDVFVTESEEGEEQEEEYEDDDDDDYDYDEEEEYEEEEDEDDEDEDDDE